MKKIMIYFLILIIIMFPTIVQAAPSGGNVVEGDASISVDGSKTEIDQDTAKTIINWNKFNINSDELVNFLQSGSNSVALNRVTGGIPSSILGELTANGQIFILNPNGILFGKDAQIDVAGLMATTLDIDNSDFMNGNYTFNQKSGATSSYVINKGDITVGDNGYVYLVAPSVDNSGLIVANMGNVTLGSGKSITLSGDGLINYNISGQLATEITGPGGQSLDYAAQNEGSIKSNGGRVVLTGDAAADVVSSVVNNTGTIEAKSLDTSDGVVKLVGRGPGKVTNDGMMDTTSIDSNIDTDGEITIQGQEISNPGTINTDTAIINATDNINVSVSDGTSNINAGTLDISITEEGAGIGASGQELEVNVDKLNASSNDGDIFVKDLGNGFEIGTVSTWNNSGDILGQVNLEAGGPITADSEVDKNITTETLDISINKQGASIGKKGKELESEETIPKKPLKVNVKKLNASTNDGNILIKDLKEGLELGSISTWNGNDEILGVADIEAVAGPITAGSGVNYNITAGAANLITSEFDPDNDPTNDNSTYGGAIGSETNKLETKLSALTADANNGDVFVNEEDGLIINSVIARKNGKSAYAKGNQIVIDSDDNTGPQDVSITAGGDVFLGEIKAPDTVNLTAEGKIFDNFGSDKNITARSLDMTSSSNIGQESNPIETTVESIITSADDGSIYIKELFGTTVKEITAGGTGNDVVLETRDDIKLKNITANGGTVKITSDKGKFIDDNDSSMNITADTADLNTKTGIASSSTPIETNIGDLIVAVEDESTPININETDGLDLIDMTTNNGSVNINFGEGSLSFNTDNKLLLTAVPGSLDFSNTGGDIVHNTLDVNTGDLNLEAGGAIYKGSTTSEIIAGSATLKADTFIGKSEEGGAISTDVDELNLVANDGSIYLNENDQLNLNAVASGQDSKIQISNNGDMTIGEVRAGDTVNLTTDSLLDGNDNRINISASSAVVNAGGTIGEESEPIDTEIGTLDLTSSNGGIYLANNGDIAKIDANSNGSGDINITTTGNMTLGQLLATGHEITLDAGGDITDGSEYSQYKIY